MILGYLRRREPNRVRSDEIKGSLFFAYPGENEVAVHRRFSDDMEHLRRVGLISYIDLRPSRSVKLTVPQKDPRMYLTLDEHNALRAARDRLGWKSATSPFTWDAGTQKLSYVVQALRLIEEGTTDVGELAQELQVRPRKVEQILARLDGIRPVSEVLAELVIERDSIDQRVTAGHVRVGSTDRPMAGRGLDEIGLMAYSSDEADDRIKLIDKALSESAVGVEGEALRSARKKLDAWRNKLEQWQG